MTEPVYDLPSVLRSLRCNDIHAGIITHEKGFLLYVGDGDQRWQTTLVPDQIRFAAGWLKRVALHMPQRIDWDRGNWEVRS